MKSFDVHVTQQDGTCTRYKQIAHDWLDVYESAIDRFGACGVTVIQP